MNKEDDYKKDADMLRIERALSELFVPPKGLEERIMGAVSSRAPAWEKKRVSLWRNPWLRYAASAAAAIVVVLGVVMLGTEGATSTNGSVGVVAEQPVQKDLRLDSHVPQQGEIQNEASRHMPLRLAGVNASLVPASSGGRLHVGIAPVLRDGWTVPDLDEAGDFLEKIGQANGKNIVVKEKNDEQVIYSVALSDAEVQSLVNLLHKENWSLVSPGYPQPKEEYNAVFTGKKVDYEIQIVRQQ
ncbi:MAG: hypothetical protein IKS20_15275 [Victivallales bacterium]|nr:hypothetical protein [Victivallales bacterium]